MTVVDESRKWCLKLAVVMLVALVHAGFGWLLMSSIGGQSSAMHVGQMLVTGVFIMVKDAERQPTHRESSAAHKVPDLTTVALAVETPYLSVERVTTSSIDGLKMPRVSVELLSEEVMKWQEAVRQAVERNWILPGGSGVSSSCRVILIQSSSGGVLGVRVLQCNADDSIRTSLLAAIYHASPLPPFPGGQATDDAEIEFQIFDAGQRG